eukprot:TRINITY_DN8662_c0_g1_i1.p1 TRINITY_DN8662_c0_g1~~TRINITY_DN8662_c0_g1_i1.p1  ORF type:complete len:133 (-),score=21.25 TRINITY_DN8662_c0_g1_i1:24-422(-)
MYCIVRIEETFVLDGPEDLVRHINDSLEGGACIHKRPSQVYSGRIGDIKRTPAQLLSIMEKAGWQVTQMMPYRNEGFCFVLHRADAAAPSSAAPSMLPTAAGAPPAAPAETAGAASPVPTPVRLASADSGLI